MAERMNRLRATFSLTALAVRSLRRRILLLSGFGALFLFAAVTMRVVAGHGEHVEPDALFELGGYPLVSALLLLGWSIGRFPILAVLALGAGLFSADLAAGHVRLLAARPTSLRTIYFAKLSAVAALAIGISALLMPAFDLVLLGRWAGLGTFALIIAYVVAYGGLLAFLSLWTRADAWIAVALALFSILWATLRRAGILATAPAGARDAVTFVLPPQDAFFALENAFAGIQPVPWSAFLFAIGYGVVWVGLAVWVVGRREV